MLVCKTGSKFDTVRSLKKFLNYFTINSVYGCQFAHIVLQEGHQGIVLPVIYLYIAFLQCAGTNSRPLSYWEKKKRFSCVEDITFFTCFRLTRLTSIFLKLTERFLFLRTIQIVDVMFETSSKADINDWGLRKILSDCELLKSLSTSDERYNDLFRWPFMLRRGFLLLELDWPLELIRNAI